MITRIRQQEGWALLTAMVMLTLMLSIGLATARLLAAEGQAVTVVGRDADRLKRALDELGANAPEGGLLSPDAVQGRTADLTSRSPTLRTPSRSCSTRAAR